MRDMATVSRIAENARLNREVPMCDTLEPPIENPQELAQPEQGEARCEVCGGLLNKDAQCVYCKPPSPAPAPQDDDNGADELNPAQGYDDPFPQNVPAPELPSCAQPFRIESEPQAEFVVHEAEHRAEVEWRNRAIAQLRQQVAELRNDLMLSEHERNILKNSLLQCGCKQDTQCPDQWYNERAKKLQRTIVGVQCLKKSSP